MSLYFTRHGETDYNKEYVIQGSIDASLNEKGFNQAKELAKKIKDLNISTIYCSPLLRAKQTAHEIEKVLNIKSIIDTRLREENYGDLEGVSRLDESYLKQRERFAYSYPNGESYLKVAARVYSFLDSIKEEAKNKNILVVAHGGMSRVVNSYFHDMENDEFIKFSIHNCELVKYDF
ncbi:MAG TPA: histidine phosphatase family protein [Firmicutes bacterium]|nr:histidine phosphatase family protein [Bacillota bacterium]